MPYKNVQACSFFNLGLIFGLILSLSLLLSTELTLTQVEWAWPLDGNFMIIQETKHGTTVENTDYSVRNLDLISTRLGHISCFGIGWHRTYHAGVDLYMAEGNTAGQPVKTIANGTVKYIDDTVTIVRTVFV